MKIDYDELEFIHPMLREILTWIEENYGEQTITSLYRINDSGVHGTLPLRACDLRCRDENRGKEIVDDLNITFQYDSYRPHMKVGRWHDVGQGPHLHIQVHPNTEWR